MKTNTIALTEEEVILSHIGSEQELINKLDMLEFLNEIERNRNNFKKKYDEANTQEAGDIYKNYKEESCKRFFDMVKR